MQITDKDIQTFRERAKTELQSNGAVGRLAWDSVVDALCNEVEELRKNAAPGNFAAKWLYRLEYHDGTCGLWYDGSGNWCFERGIGSLDDSCKTKSLPMDYDERYRQDGRSWFSSCSRKEDLLHWYSREDAKRLLSHGFVFTRYLATEYREYDQQTVFIKETCLYREEIDFESLWKSSSPGNAAALREALESTEELLEHFAKPGTLLADAFALHMRDNLAALAAPPRNCDVGDAAEQSERLAKFCKANYEKAKKDKHICSECRFNDCPGECPLKWAQLPFIPEKGGAE